MSNDKLAPTIPLQVLKNNRGKERPTVDDSALFVSDKLTSLPDVSEDKSSLVLQEIEKGEHADSKITLIPIAKVKVSPFQNRLFKVNESDDYIANLAANIEKDELTNPIIVRIIDDYYELIAGENRMKAYELNGDEFIPAIIKEYDDIGAAKKTILDNVFHKTVTPYELYIGYQMLLDMDAFKNQAQLAKEVGISNAEMSRILSFGKLPTQCQELISTKPHLLGSTIASELVTLCEDNRDGVIEAVEKIISEEMQQSRAPGFVRSKDVAKTKVENRPVHNKKGDTAFTLKRTGNDLTIHMTKYGNIPDIEDIIFKFLEEQAEKIVS